MRMSCDAHGTCTQGVRVGEVMERVLEWDREKLCAGTRDIPFVVVVMAVVVVVVLLLLLPKQHLLQ